MGRTSGDTAGRPRSAKALAVVERALLAFGFLCLVVYVSACANRSLFQRAESRQFDEHLALVLASEQHDQSEWSPTRIDAHEASRTAPVEALGRLEIPAANVSVMVLEGTEEETLDRAVGRIEGTAQIGEVGNVGIAGHRDAFFRGLRHLAPGDDISLASHAGLTRYRVTGISIVEPEDVGVLDPTPVPVLTLVTCYPFYFVGSAPQRYIVRADQVAFEPWTQDTAGSYVAGADTAP